MGVAATALCRRTARSAARMARHAARLVPTGSGTRIVGATMSHGQRGEPVGTTSAVPTTSSP